MNYYEILKISKTATDSEIKTSYKQLVKKYHPDLYVGDKEFAEKKIKEINEAYAILSNPEMKAEYDAFLNPPDSFMETPSHYQSTTQPKTNSTSTQQSSEWSLSKIILEKFSKLDNKRQLQIVIAILVVILAFFLINLIEVKYYLTNQESKNNNASNSIENITSTFIESNENNSNTFYEENEFKTLDDLFYDLFMQYQQNTIYENQF